MFTKTQKDMQSINELSNKVIGAAIEVHKNLKAGFREKIYQAALEEEMEKKGMRFAREKEIQVLYKNKHIGKQRVDFIVNDEIVVETKCVERISEAHIAQTLSYLTVLGKRLALILNFAEPQLGIKRVIK
ncbi:MAG: GxxExxY protein [Candidatus Omnitrophota bacterium]